MKKLRHIFFNIISLCLILGCVSDVIPKAYAESAMTASESCITFIKQVEGFASKPYYDYSQHTVGYGTKCPTDKYFDYMADGIPEEEADALLRETVADISETIREKLIKKYHVTFSQHQFDALVSFTFNLGSGWMTYDSILRNAILRHASEDDLVYAFSLYSTAGGKYLSGLLTRRLCEANMYLNGVYNKKLSNAYGYVLYEPNGGSLTYQAQGFICGNNTAPVADAVRSGDVFTGWYTDLTGGTKVTALDSTLTGKTLFARWQSAEDSKTEDSPSTIIRVTGDVVNIRKGPGTNYGIAAQVRRNDVQVVSHVTELSNMKWGKVQDGWICLDYTNYDDLLNGTDAADPEQNEQPSDENTLPDENPEVDNTEPDIETDTDHQETVWGIVRVNDLLRIRSGPGTNHVTVGYLFDGRKIEITEQTTVGSMVWGRISRGWVSMDYITILRSDTDSTIIPDPENNQETEPGERVDESTGQETEPGQENQQEENSVEQTDSLPIKGTITADALRIRSGPGAEYGISGFYYQNDPVIVSEKVLVNSAYWGKTDKGWIHMDYVKTVSNVDEPDSSEEGRRLTVIADCLRVRKETGTNSRIAALLYYGDTLTVYETTTVDGVDWGRVDKGWVCMDYVQ